MTNLKKNDVVVFKEDIVFDNFKKHIDISEGDIGFVYEILYEHVIQVEQGFLPYFPDEIEKIGVF